MAHFHIKKKGAKSYLYIREMARVNGKPKVVSQIYLGSPSTVASLASAGAGLVKVKVEEFGSLWLANEIDREFDLAGIINSLIPRECHEKGPSIGEFFLYCVLNRMIDTTSKNELSSWYEKTAIQQIRPVDLFELSSQRYWEKWDRVHEEDLTKISITFFHSLAQAYRESLDPECVLFDTSNYYTFMASSTSSDLAKQGKNKEGRNNLRQVGLGLLVSRGSKLPLFYSVYPGNVHDSRQFGEIAQTMLFEARNNMGFNNTSLTVVVDKGMNKESTFTWLDTQPFLHFVTTYSICFENDLAALNLDQFKPVEIPRNQGREEEDQMLFFRTKKKYWGTLRTVIVTYSPKTARKQTYTFEAKIAKLKTELDLIREKVNQGNLKWTDTSVTEERCHKSARSLHLPCDLFSLSFTELEGHSTMEVGWNEDNMTALTGGFGRNVIVTDQDDWTSTEIIQASLDRWQVEDEFRLSKDEAQVAIRPIRHFTDSKIKAHLFSSVVALTYLRLLELRLKNAGIDRTAQSVMKDMSNLHSVLLVNGSTRKSCRRLETPTKAQAEILSVFGSYVDDNGVLQYNKG